MIQLMASLAIERAGETVVQHAVRSLLDFVNDVEDGEIRGSVLPISR
jgi:hypothetical protein